MKTTSSTLKVSRFGILFLTFITAPFIGRAQWVPVSPGFASYISTFISAAAINSNQLDTTNSAVTSLQNLTINPSTVTDITGIQYFDNLKNLVVNSGTLVATPTMPPGLLTLQLVTAGATIAPYPAGLTTLKINGGSFTVMPAFPASLTKLIIGNLTNAPVIPVLPMGLQHLEINNMPQAFTVFPAIPSTITFLNFSGTEIGPGISLQAGLDTFLCYGCQQLSSITNIPATLNDLEVPGCNLTALGTLPGKMYRLDVSDNPLAAITLPDTLTGYLWMYEMPSLTSIGTFQSIAIGSSLFVHNTPNIDVAALLGKVHNTVPQGVTVSAHHCNISTLPQFHALISSLDVSYNSIIGLPAQGQLDPQCVGSYCQYPMEYLYSLDISHCQVSNLNYGFFNHSANGGYGTSVDASYNQFTQVDWTPAGSGNSLNLSHNQITAYNIPVYPNSTDLSYNQLSCLPYIYPGAVSLNIINNHINCLPNIPDSSFHCTPNLGVCQAGNSNNCAVLALSGGHIFNDANHNGVRNNGEGLLAGYSAMMTPDNSIHLSDYNGSYNFNCLPNVAYTIDGVCPYPYRYVTTAPYTATYTQPGQIDTIHDIGIYTLPDVNDMLVRLTAAGAARPGFGHQYHVTARNEGTTVQNGNVVMYFGAGHIYQSSNPAGTVSGNSISWPLTALAPLNSFNADVYFNVSATVALGDTVRAGLYALCNTPDTTLTDNHDTLQQIAIGSYDPNTKEVLPAHGLALEEAQNGTYLDYTVRFQNTGTASAINVHVEDTLSALLDLTSFEILAASHNYHWRIESRVLTVYFDNINLPDSNSNERLSHGFFRYRIKPVTGISAGQQIVNTAHIYFDFNPAVVTNTTTTGITTLFAVQPTSHQLCSGEHLRLVAKAGVPVVSGRWYLNGQPTTFTGDTLYIDSAATSHSGEFTYVITLANGELYSSNKAYVQVYDHLATVPAYQLTANTITGDTLRVCYNNNSGTAVLYSLTGASPYYDNYRWYVNDTLLDFTGVPKTYIARQWHTGDHLTVYIDRPCTGAIPVAGVMAVVSVPDTMRVWVSPHNPSVCQGQQLTFTAQAEHSLNTLFQWYRNGAAVPTGSIYTAYNLSANDEIVAVASQPANNGCTAIAQVGSHYYNRDTSRVVIDNNLTNPPVQLVAELRSPAFCEGISNTVLATGANMGGGSHYQWLLNGVPFGTDTNVLTGTGFTTGDVVQYRLARQLCTTDTFYSNELVLNTDSTGPQSVQINYSFYICPASVTFTAALQNIGTGSIYRWYVNGVQRSSNSTFTYSRTDNTQADTVILKLNTRRTCTDSILYSNEVILPPFEKMVRPDKIEFIEPTAFEACANQYVSFSTTNFPHNWYTNGVSNGSGNLFSTYGTTDFTVMDIRPGNTCYVADTAGPVTIHIRQNIVPDVSLEVTPAAICSGQNVTGHIASNLSSYTSNWYYNDQDMGPGTLMSFQQPAEGDVIKVVVQPTGNCNTSNAPVTDSLVVHYISQTPVAEVSPSAPLNCNTGAANVFTADGYYLGPNPTYQWMKNGNPVGSNSYQYADNALQPNDAVYCLVTSNNPCITGNTAITNIVTYTGGVPVTPAVSISAPTTTVCGNAPLQFTATPVNAGANPTYVWQLNGLAAGAPDSPAFTYSGFANGDEVSVNLQSSSNCVTNSSAVSASIAITVTIPDTPAVNITASQNAICPGQSVSFSAAAVSGGSSPVYQWQVNGAGNSTGTTFAPATIANGDTVICILTSSESCVTSATMVSNPVEVTVYPAPAVPLISVTNHTITSSATGNQWYLNGSAIPGANGVNYTAVEDGYYSTEATDANGCIAKSDSVLVIVSGIGGVNENVPFMVYPNPATSQVIIYTGGGLSGAAITLYNVTGQKVLTDILTGTTQTISVANFARGVYFVNVTAASGHSYQVKLVLQ